MWPVLQQILAGVRSIIAGVNLAVTKINQIIANQEKIMAELDDLKAAQAKLTDAVAGVATQIDAETKKILTLIAAPQGVDPAAVEASAQAISGLADSLNKTVADAQTALPTA